MRMSFEQTMCNISLCWMFWICVVVHLAQPCKIIIINLISLKIRILLTRWHNIVPLNSAAKLTNTDIENDLSSYDITSYYLHPGSAKDFLSSNMVFITIRLWGKGVSYISATIAKQTLQHFYKCNIVKYNFSYDNLCIKDSIVFQCGCIFVMVSIPYIMQVKLFCTSHAIRFTYIVVTLNIT